MNREQQVSQLVNNWFGEPPLAIQRMTFGHNSQTFEVTLPGRSLIIRTNEQANVFAHTAQNLAILGQLGLPVPTVIASDLRYPPFAWMMLEKIPGRDLRYELSAMSQKQMGRLANQLVAFQQKVATLPPGRGFGYVAINQPAPFATWLDLFEAESHLYKAAPIPILVEPLGRLRHLAAQTFNPYLSQVSPQCFLDDITIKNVIVQHGELQGLVDFDCVCYGDPLFMVALTATGIVCDIGFSALAYIQELSRAWQLTPLQIQITAFYAALFAIDFVRVMAPDQPPVWTSRMTKAIYHWLLLAENEATSFIVPTVSPLP